MKRLRLIPLLGGVVVVLLAHLVQAQSEEPRAGSIWILQIDGAIGPATSDYIVRGIEEARDNDASLIVIEMDTPGGLDASMREIIASILASDVAVASWVTPRGARAASAGTYILYASHFAVMNEATNLGAATPVQIVPSTPAPGSPQQPAQGDGDGDDKQSETAKPQGGSAMEKKMVNDASAYIRGLAELRGRNAEWAEKAVREGVSLSAHQAVELNVVDFIVTDLTSLVDRLDQQTVTLNDQSVSLELAGKPIHNHEPDWRTELLATLTNPNMVLILGMFGIYGILLEFYNPGTMIPGTVGIICLILAGYALQLLPVNYAGLGLMAVGIGLMVAEAMAPSFGVMGIGGIIAFIIGGIMLFDTDVEAFQIGIPALAAIGIVAGLIIIGTINVAIKMRNREVTTGIDRMVGETGEALTEIDKKGQVRIGGEIWRASSPVTIPDGQAVRVTDVNGMELTVEPIEETSGQTT